MGDMARIAVIENESLIALDVARTLERAGYGILGPFEDAVSFFEATATLDDASSPSLALVDINLPGDRDGIEIAEMLALGGRTGVVFLTAHEEASTLERAKKTRPLGYIVKPFGQRDLLRTVDMALYRCTMDRRLTESERRYRTLFERDIAARFVCDRKGRIGQKNHSFETLFGSDCTDITGLLRMPERWTDALHSLDSGGVFGPVELDLRGPGGTDRRVIFALCLLPDDASGEAVISGEAVDQTEETMLRESVAQSRKMEAMGRLASGVAHDFNNVLTAIMGHATLLKGDLPSGSKALEDLDGILAASEKASALTRQLLAFSRRQRQDPRALDPAESLRGAERMLRRLVGERIAFTCEYSADMPKVMSDPAQIDQVFLNLVMNARDALEDRPNAWISARVASVRLDAARQVGDWMLKPGKYAVLEVADNGKGMTPEVASRIFEPFFTTKDAGRGTGLGLSILYGIASRSNGAIGVESRPGEGSTISLWLPAISGVPSPAETPASETTPSEKARAASGDASSADRSLVRGLRILITEDEDIVLASLARVFERAGASVVAVRNPGEAVLAAEHSAFDLLVADIALPYMNGYDLADRLAREGRVGAVLFITGKSDTDRSLAAGRPLLEKPFANDALFQAVRAALSRR